MKLDELRRAELISALDPDYLNRLTPILASLMKKSNYYKHWLRLRAQRIARENMSVALLALKVNREDPSEWINLLKRLSSLKQEKSI